MNHCDSCVQAHREEKAAKALGQYAPDQFLLVLALHGPAGVLGDKR